MIEWKSVSFLIDYDGGIPPSKNTTNWGSVKSKISTKKKWREIFIKELFKLDLPCPLPKVDGTPVIAIVTLRFSPRAQDPEAPNYRPAIEECLLDALWRSDAPSVQGWIDHDKDDQVRLSLHQMEERGDPRSMLVELRWMELETTLEEFVRTPFFETDGPVAQLP